MKKFFALALAAASVYTVSAQEATEVPADGKIEIPQAAQMIQVAGQLVKYGYANQEALPLIQAIEIYQSTVTPGAKMDKTEEGEATESAQKTSNVSFEIAQLTADATKFADGDANLLGLIEGLKDGATRGATYDYPVHYDRVVAHGTDTYKVQFRGGEQAIVVVNGDGDTDLDVYVYNSSGNLVAKDIDNTDTCLCAWTPRYTSTYTIKIVNRGSVYNRYAMAVN